MNPDLPTGTVTFLFTDIEGSTELWESSPDAMKDALAVHDALLRAAIGAHGGHIIKGSGDGFHAAFAAAASAVEATLEAQRAIRTSEVLKTSEVSLRIRMGLHTGEAELRDGDYFGQALNRAARVMSAGHGGQVLLSELTAQVAREHLDADVSLLDLGMHHLRGLTNPERLYQLSAPGLETDFPALNTISSATHNLPAQLTSFIGRQRELSEARTKLAAARLLTLIGPGGIGKTRLALQIAAQQLEDFKKGAWLIELAPLTDTALITPTIASIFDVREVPGVPLINLVIDYLRGKQLLLILDNCEHLVEVSAHIAAQLLHACPDLKIIASSREALGIEGETVFRVPSLPLPAERPAASGAERPAPSGLEDPGAALMEFEGTRLFIERSAKAEPRFQVTAENAAAIVQICRRLDGIPLAIELAAARVKMFTPQEIAERLDDRFKLLTGGSRTAVPRQQTLQALIDWSYQSLTELEQRTLRQLAVFSGGFTYEAAELVTGAQEALDGLPGLVNKSLVNVEDASGKSRYTLLESIRQYAMEKLVEAGEASATRDRHLQFVLALAGQTEVTVFDVDRPELLDRMEAENDNLRSAIEWAASNHLEKAAKLIQALGGFWTARDYNFEAREWCKLILAKTESRSDMDLARAQLYALSGWSSMTMGEHKDALADARRGLELARKSNDPLTTVRSYGVMALASIFLGDFATAEEAGTVAEKIAREHGLHGELALVLSSRAQLAFFVRGDPVQAKTHLEEAAKLAQTVGYRWANSLSVFGLARTAAALGDVEGARTGFQRSAELARKMGNKRIIYSSQSEFAHILREHGQLDEPLRTYIDLLPKWKDLGHRPAVAHELECIAFILIRKEEPVRAATLLGAAEALRELIDSVMTFSEKDQYETEVSALRAGMDEAEFALHWSKGRSLSMDQAIAYAQHEYTTHP